MSTDRPATEPRTIYQRAGQLREQLEATLSLSQRDHLRKLLLAIEAEAAQGAAPRFDLREQLAALEHEQWEKWSRTVAEQGLTPERIERWQRYWVPYADLDEATKDFDREWAGKALALIEGAAPRAEGLDWSLVIEAVSNTMVDGDLYGLPESIAAEYARLSRPSDERQEATDVH